MILVPCPYCGALTRALNRSTKSKLCVPCRLPKGGSGNSMTPSQRRAVEAEKRARHARAIEAAIEKNLARARARRYQEKRTA